MAEHALTLKFRGVEAELLSLIVELGICNTKAEAIRSSLINWSKELGIYKEALSRSRKASGSSSEKSLDEEVPSSRRRRTISLADLEKEFSS